MQTVTIANEREEFEQNSTQVVVFISINTLYSQMRKVTPFAKEEYVPQTGFMYLSI